MRHPNNYESAPLCPRCDLPMHKSRLAQYFCGTVTPTFECETCDAVVLDRSALVKALAPAAA